MNEIFVCEDNAVHREKVNTYINNYLMIENLDMNLSLSTDSPEELLNYIKGEKFKGEGLYFLDVDLNADITGIVLGSEIRKLDPQATIVFITTHAELSYLTFIYKVEALDYIFKDEVNNVKSRIIECINIVRNRNSTPKTISRKRLQQQFGGKVVNVYYDDIMFIESSSNLHKIIMHCDNRQMEFYGKLKEFEELDGNFYRCHNSYVVNKDNIVEIDKKEKIITMRNGEECYASVRALKGLLTKN